ncbi:Amidase [Melia azedarach]|uniref:Amidase n=1 Tax=Melia azedarach TaxID=155640 RepID=A0ACC1XZZ2_MELAZ|nr:Amidase [Melia azedarach]
MAINSPTLSIPIFSFLLLIGQAIFSSQSIFNSCPCVVYERSNHKQSKTCFQAKPTHVKKACRAVSLGTETDSSFLCPSSSNSVVGIKSTVGLTSCDGVFPISPWQDTVGPIARSVADAVYVLNAIVGCNHNDEGTREASKYIPYGGYKQFLRPHGLKGKRLGILRNLVNNFALKLLSSISRRSVKFILDSESSMLIMQEMIEEYGQYIFEIAEATVGIDEDVKAALENLPNLSRNGFEKLMENKLNAVVTPGLDIVHVLAIGGFPGINVPA